MKYLYLFPHFQSVCAPRSEMGLFWTAYIWVLYPFSQSVSFIFIYFLILLFFFSLCLLDGVFNPFIFKVIIGMYIPITIFLIVLGLFL